MNKSRMRLSIAVMTAILHLILMPSSLVGWSFDSNSLAGWSFEVKNGFSFGRGDTTVEHLDRNRYKGTAVTTEWTAGRNLCTYLITPEVIWQNADWHVYATANVDYGWLIDGKFKNNPLEWKAHGSEWGFSFEAGYVLNVCKRFTLLPHIGFTWDETRYRFKHQKETHINPTCFRSQNGNRNTTLIYYPYIGFELDFTTTLWNCKKIQISLEYNVGYGAGHGRTSVRHPIINDSPATSRLANHTKYRDMIYQDFELAFAYGLTDHWRVALELDYSVYYNTHKLPLKFKHNDALVREGQFTRSQYHRVSDVILRNYTATLVLNYSFGTEGTWIR